MPLLLEAQKMRFFSFFERETSKLDIFCPLKNSVDTNWTGLGQNICRLEIFRYGWWIESWWVTWVQHVWIKKIIGQQDFMFDKLKCNCLTCWSTYHLNHDETDNNLGGWITDTKLNRHFVWGIYLEPMKYHPIRRFWICIHYVRTICF